MTWRIRILRTAKSFKTPIKKMSKIKVL
jgi:hypothetical protein